MGIYLNPGNDLFYSTVTYSEIYFDYCAGRSVRSM